ncbi:MAG: hypothetical protein IT260_20230 [Saprospiraceae bacterium]|nr:hypothetical protein [Saprospiraceae bacterium]
MSEKESDQFLNDLIRQKMDRDTKADWAQKLEDQYQISRSDTPLVAQRSTVAYRWMGIAATLVLLVMAVWMYRSQDGFQARQLADSFIREEQLPYAGFRKGADAVLEKRMRAVDAYQRKDFNTAIDTWQQLQAQPEFSPDDQFFLGMCYLYNGQAAQALSAFGKHEKMDNPGNRFVQERQFFSALALIKTGDPNTARSVLQALEQSTTSQALRLRATKVLAAMGD